MISRPIWMMTIDFWSILYPWIALRLLDFDSIGGIVFYDTTVQ